MIAIGRVVALGTFDGAKLSNDVSLANNFSSEQCRA